MPLIEVVEGEEFTLPKKEADRLRLAVERLHAQLRPSFALLSERLGKLCISNVVGTIDIGAGTLIRVSPKVPHDCDWATAVVDLLTGREGIEIAGERRAGRAVVHNNLLDALAGTFLDRLEKAYRQEGPIVLMDRKSVELPYLHGKLNATKWARSAVWRPQIFPVSRTELAQDNPFTWGLLKVAESLSRATSSHRIRNSLKALSRDLSAGMPYASTVPEGLAERRLPEQWSAYRPAWSLAIAILSRTSLLGASGFHHGVGVAVEAWPLLETLLERTLQSMVQLGKEEGRSLHYRVQGETSLLRPLGPPPQRRFSPCPDGRLYEGNTVLATFEAKYTRFDGALPSRDHIYQAVSTAATCGAATAIIVYPQNFSPLIWEIDFDRSRPRYLVAVGLNIFKVLSAAEARSRAASLLDLVGPRADRAPGRRSEAAIS